MKKKYHIDTLYLSLKIDNILDYRSCCEVLALKPKLYYRDGRDFYNFGFCRVGVMDWDICLSNGNYPFSIEYNFEYLYQQDFLKSVDSIKLPFNLPFDNYLVKRMDYNITFVNDGSILDSYFVSPYFQKGSDHWGTGRKEETKYLGLRKTGKVFRIYNKFKELKDKPNFIKQDMISKEFGSIKNLYTIELEMLRKYIISRTDLNGSLSDWSELLQLSLTLLASVKFCSATDKNLKLLRQKNHKRIEFKTHDVIVENFEFVKVKKYEKSRFNLLMNIDKFLDNYNSYDGEKLSYEELSRHINKLAEIKKHNGKF